MSGWISTLVVSFAVAANVAATPFSSQQSAISTADRAIRSDVQHRIGGLDGSSKVTVNVEDGVVTLTGTVPTLWVKEEAVRRALKANQVKSPLVSELTIPRAENDTELARKVVERVRTYDRYSVYDNIDGRVNNGVVSLSGAVTQPEKASDILERVAKVRGVQAIDNKIDVLPSSQSDDRLRNAIATAIYRDPAFENYSMVDPPIHVIVNNSHVTLIGFVRSQIELLKAESAARAVFGVLALDNKVQLIGKQPRAR
jgi:osmotically-inducible protein OsmY